MSQFIVVEGIDATGKTTLCKKLCSSLGYKYLYSIPPEFTKYRDVVLSPESGDLSRFMYYISGILAMQKNISEILKQGDGIIMDRFIYSTIAYHKAYGIDTDCLDLLRLNIIWPEKTILLITNHQTRMSRLEKRGNINKHEINKTFQEAANNNLIKLIKTMTIDTTKLSKTETLKHALLYIKT